jgi:hypothetical protein
MLFRGNTELIVEGVVPDLASREKRRNTMCDVVEHCRS